MRFQVVTEYRDETCGFPVVFDEIFMVDMYGEKVPLIDYVALERKILGQLSEKKGRLTGPEVKFIRKQLNMTLTDFGNRLGVRHSAVKKWEAGVAVMNWATEIVLRLFVFMKMRQGSLESFFDQITEAPLSESEGDIFMRVRNADVNTSVVCLLDPRKDRVLIREIKKRLSIQWTFEVGAQYRAFADTVYQDPFHQPDEEQYTSINSRGQWYGNYVGNAS